jgi:hypothetical protein
MSAKKLFTAPELLEYGRLSELTNNHEPNTGQNPCNAHPNGSPPENAKQGLSFDCMSIGSS